MDTQQTIQIFFITVKVLLESRWSSSRLRWRGGRDDVWEGVRTTYSTPQDPTLLSFIWILGVSLPSFTE